MRVLLPPPACRMGRARLPCRRVSGRNCRGGVRGDGYAQTEGRRHVSLLAAAGPIVADAGCGGEGHADGVGRALRRCGHGTAADVHDVMEGNMKHYPGALNL